MVFKRITKESSMSFEVKLALPNPYVAEFISEFSLSRDIIQTPIFLWHYYFPIRQTTSPARRNG